MCIRDRPRIGSVGNFARTRFVTIRPSTIPSRTIASSMNVVTRVAYCCTTTSGVSSAMNTRIASGMNRPMRLRRESTRSRM